MELNKEQTIKALECCGGGIVTDCQECPRYYIDADTTTECMEGLIRDALALIKELAEEVEQRIEDYSESQKSWEIAYDKLEVENERLQIQADMWESTAYCEKDRCNTIEVATVLKMRSEIERRCIEGGIYPAFVKRVINNVAEEMVKPI